MISEEGKKLILSKIAFVRAKINEAQIADFAQKQVILIGVTKNREPEVLPILAEAGIFHFAENRVQELVKKRDYWEALPPKDRGQAIRWHLIGSLQKNKVKTAVSYADTIHSVDSVALYERLAMEAEKQKKHIEVFLQVNISGEESKHGFTEEEVRAFWLTLPKPSPWIKLIGLMTMAPKESTTTELQNLFAQMRVLRDRLDPALQLSMGMSNDYKIAIAEGATHIRLGRILFE